MRGLEMRWLVLLSTILGLALLGCEMPADDDDDDNDDATGDDDDDDSATDDDDVAEDCWEINLYGGGEGTYTVSGGDDHEKYSFTMQENITHAIATLTWDDETRGEWIFGLDVGEGTCPDYGTLWATAESGGGEVVTHVYAGDLPGEPQVFPNGANTFVHLGVQNPAEHEVGDSVDFQVSIELCQPE